MKETTKPTFEQIIEANKIRIYRICQIYAVSPIEPEDLFQEITIQIWKAYSTFEGKSEISTWVYRIALNVSIRYNSQLNKFNDKTVRLQSIQFETSVNVPDLSGQERYHALYHCIKALNEKDQAIVILSLDELAYKEIAEITGLTENHIAVKMKRVRKLLLNCVSSKLK